MHAGDWIVALKCSPLPVFTTNSCQQILPLNSLKTDTRSLDLPIPPSKPRYQSKQQSSHYSIRHQLLAHHPERKEKKTSGLCLFTRIYQHAYASISYTTRQGLQLYMPFPQRSIPIFPRHNQSQSSTYVLECQNQQSLSKTPQNSYSPALPQQVRGHRDLLPHLLSSPLLSSPLLSSPLSKPNLPHTLHRLPYISYPSKPITNPTHPLTHSLTSYLIIQTSKHILSPDNTQQR